MKGSRARKLGLALATVAMVSLVVALSAAARPEPDATGATAATTTVTLSGWASSPAETAALRSVIAAFQRQNRNVRVNYAPISGDYDAAMLARFAARRPPDVFYVESLDFLDYLPALEPLNKYIAQSRRTFSTKPFFPRLLNAFKRGKTIYGLPKDWSPLGMIVNPAMLQRAGVTTPPRTWAQLTTALTRLQSTNAVPGGAPACLSLDWARILPFMIQNRGHFITNGRATVNTPQNVATLNRYLGWIQSGLARTPAQLGVGWCGEALGREKAAVVFEGNWIVGFMQEQHPNVRFRIDRMVRNQQEGNLGFTVAYAMGKAGRNKAAAWRLLRFLVNRQGMGIWTRGGIALPSRSDVRVPAGRANLQRAAPAARPWQFGKGFQRVIDAAGNELTATFEGKQTVNVMLQKIQTLVAEALRG
jgi:multiple sugar transport system substrate-binding protein